MLRKHLSRSKWSISMSQHNRPIKRDNNDNTIVMLVVGLVLILAIYFLINRYSVILYQNWKILFLPLARGISLIAGSVIGDIINPLLGTTKSQAAGLVQFISLTPVNHWNVRGFIAMNRFIGKYLLVLLLPLGIYGLVRVFRNTQQTGSQYRRFKNSNALSAYILSSDTKQIAKLRENVSSYGDATALSCAMFCKKHDLITLDKLNDSVTDLDYEASYKVFAQQLGDNYMVKSDLFEGDYGWVAKCIMEHIPESHKHESQTTFM